MHRPSDFVATSQQALAIRRLRTLSAGLGLPHAASADEAIKSCPGRRLASKPRFLSVEPLSRRDEPRR